MAAAGCPFRRRKGRNDRHSQSLFGSDARRRGDDAAGSRRTIFKETIMGYERYPRASDPQDDYYGRSDPQDYHRDGGYSSTRDYGAAGQTGGRERPRDGGRQGYGSRDFGDQRYGQGDQFSGQRGDYGTYGR